MFHTPREEKRLIARSGRTILLILIGLTFVVAFAFLFGHLVA